MARHKLLMQHPVFTDEQVLTAARLLEADGGSP
jgi:hypothetical protein